MKTFTVTAACLLLLSCSKEAVKQDTSAPVKSAVSSNAQVGDIIGNQQVIQVPIDDFGTLTNALLYLPPDYNPDDKQRYPLIINLHGDGESGTDVSLLLNAGLPQQIANGFQPAGVNPVDGKKYEFIVLSPQAPDWSYQEMHLKYMYKKLVKEYHIDRKRVYVTGYSAGGYGTWTCDTDDPDICKSVAAIVPVSSAGVEGQYYLNGETISRYDNIPNAAAYGLAVWSICGEDDTFWSTAVDYTDKINAANPIIPAKLTGLAGVGHSAWNQAYDPTWKEDGLNIYDWMLQYSRK